MKNGNEKVLQLSIQTLTPITANGRVTIDAAGAVCVQNTGDDTATIDNQFQIFPGQAISFNTGDDASVIVANLLIRFAGVGIAPRVEFMVLAANLPGYGNYISQ